MFSSIVLPLIFAGILGAFFAMERDLSGVKNDWGAHALAGLLACLVGLTSFSATTNYLDYLIVAFSGAILSAICLRAVLMFALACWRGTRERSVDTITLAFAFLVGASCAAGDAKLVVVVMLLMAGVSVFRGGTVPVLLANGIRPSGLDFVLLARNSVLKRIKIAVPYLFGFGPLARAANAGTEQSNGAGRSSIVVIDGLSKSIELRLDPHDALSVANQLKLVAIEMRSERNSLTALARLNEVNSEFRSRAATLPRADQTYKVEPTRLASSPREEIPPNRNSTGFKRLRQRLSADGVRLPSHNVSVRQPYPAIQRRLAAAHNRQPIVHSMHAPVKN